MLRPRIIPCLLVQDGGLVKTVGFKDPKYVGDPINAVKIFNEKEADELMVLDIDATAHSREPNFRLIGQFAAECRMPLAYGGGVGSAAQAKRIIGLGVEKVTVSAAALARPELIGEMADEVGRQSVVVVIDVRKKLLGGWEVYSHNGKRACRRDAIDWAREAAERGAGEIVLNSIDRDGVMKGYDVTLAQTALRALRVPLTVLGGAGSHADLQSLIAACGTIGAAAGSIFVFKGAYRAVLINYPNAQQKESLIAAAAGPAGH
jgi:cyclase